MSNSFPAIWFPIKRDVCAAVPAFTLLSCGGIMVQGCQKERCRQQERSMIRKLSITVPFVVLLASGSAIAVTATMRPAETQAVVQLLKLMDTDQNGKVSKAEYMTFMAAEFDRLDADKSGELDVNELANLRVVSAKKPGGSGSR
jgi:hypothetical protein